MTDHGDGTYSHTFTIDQGYGTITASVSVLTEGAVYSEYWQNQSFSGPALYSWFEPNIDNYW